jgi:hypothetical protein
VQLGMSCIVLVEILRDANGASLRMTLLRCSRLRPRVVMLMKRIDR